MPKISKNVNIEKAKYWAFVAYPDSLPENWQDILSATGLPCVISPLHDADINADDTQKKAHYHIIMCFSNTTTYTNAKRVSDSLNATIPQSVKNIKGYYRYLTHADNPEKAQYSENDIVFINGFCPSDYFDLSMTEEESIYDRLEEYIVDNKITEYFDLMLKLRADGLRDLLSFARRHTYHINACIKSWRHMQEKRESGAAGPGCRA